MILEKFFKKRDSHSIGRKERGDRWSRLDANEQAWQEYLSGVRGETEDWPTERIREEFTRARQDYESKLRVYSDRKDEQLGAEREEEEKRGQDRFRALGVILKERRDAEK